ncbi:MAG: hypothetical protein M3Y87_35085 [Myxococcota bacterium]|nr:hypothetical protein [Myxococcota bacterium]
MIAGVLVARVLGGPRGLRSLWVGAPLAAVSNAAAAFIATAIEHPQASGAAWVAVPFAGLVVALVTSPLSMALGAAFGLAIVGPLAAFDRIASARSRLSVGEDGSLVIAWCAERRSVSSRSTYPTATTS